MHYILQPRYCLQLHNYSLSQHNRLTLDYTHVTITNISIKFLILLAEAQMSIDISIIERLARKHEQMIVEGLYSIGICKVLFYSSGN